MVFNSLAFFIFFLLFLPAYYALPHRGQNRLIVFASYVFYGWCYYIPGVGNWAFAFCGLLAFSTVLDWACGLLIEQFHEERNHRRAKLWVTVSVVGQLLLLAVFKYLNFFEDNIRAFVRHFGGDPQWPVLKLVLPVGISFYTFQTLSYTIDIYRRKLKPVRDLLDFAVFVSFWPHLVAGPILRATFLLPQVLAPRRVGPREWSEGTYFFLVGMVKKVAIADVVSPYVKAAFENPGSMSPGQLLVSAYLFAIQIYCDFSGYTDMARGCSLFLGFRLVENFRFPYFATSIRDFWRRWHISLSQWLRDYLYISLGGNRGGRFATYRNLFLTMLLGGLWHGAKWNFVAWGALHGLYLAVERMMIEESEKAAKLKLASAAALDSAAGDAIPAAPLDPRAPIRVPLFSARKVASHFLGWLVTFHLVCLAWIFFAAKSLHEAKEYLQGFLAGGGLQGFARIDGSRAWMLAYSVALILAIDLPEALTGRHEYLADRPRLVRAVFYALAIMLVLITWSSNNEPFIYFQF